MKKKEEKRRNKSRGVTLIALIITIIVLIILTSVAVDVAVDGSLFDKAQDTVDKTNQKVGKVQNDVYSLEDEMDETMQFVCKHEEGEWVIIKEATAMENGIKEKECSECGKILQEIIPVQNGIEFTFTTPSSTWTKEDVVVTASIADTANIAQLSQTTTNEGLIMRLGDIEDNHEFVLANNAELTVQMSRDGTNWETTNSLTYTANGKVYARVMNNGTQVGGITEGEVTNIDKEPPSPGYLLGFEDEALTIPVETIVDEYNGKIIEVGGNCNDEDFIDWVYIKFMNGSDDKSGIAKTTFSISGYSVLGYNYSGEYEYVIDESNPTLPIMKFKLASSTNDPDVITSRAVLNLDTYFDITIKSEDKAGNESTDYYCICITKIDL